MTTSGLDHPASQVAAKPFQFASAASLIRIEREQARNLVQLLDSLSSCSEASIFNHTIQTLEEHHFIREGLTNDFAQWVYADLSEAELAEQLGGIDVRSFTSVGALREQLVSTVGGYLQQNPFANERPAFKPF